MLSEVCDLFPGRWLHTGGDECPATSWQNCPACRKRAADQGLYGVSNLQNWFTREIAEFLLTRHKVMIGWEEILNSELPPETVVMVWKGDGMEVARQAFARQHQIILSPGSFYYFDWKQLNSEDELGSFGVTTLSKTFSYDPLDISAAEKDRSLILGVQGNIWTERLTNENQVSYMAFPRALAIAETGWAKQRYTMPEFLKKVSMQSEFLKDKGINLCEKVE